MRNKGLKWMVVGVALTLLGLAWVSIAPKEMGGSKSYVVIEGQSMEPKFHRGDLVVLDSTADYEVGDVVGYQSKKLGHAVLHRIIGRDGGRYVFKGDNNTWVDSERPTAGELIGKLWVHVPGAGKHVTGLGEPRNAALFAGFMTLLVGGFSGKKVRRRRGRHVEKKERSMPERRFSPAPAQFTSGILAAVGVLTVLCLVLAVVAFGRPVEKLENASVPYTQTASFGYSAPAPAGPVYDGKKIEAGEPVYLNLVDEVDLTFDYELSADVPFTAEGDASMSILLKDVNGWSRTLPLVGSTPVEDGRVHMESRLDLTTIQDLLRSVERRTGIDRDMYTLTVIPSVQTSGTVGGQEISETYSPRLAFNIDDLQLQLQAETPGTEADSGKVLEQTTSSEIIRPQSVPNILSIPGPDVTVAAARRMAIVGGLACLLVLGGLAAYSFMLRRGDASNRIAARYGHMMVSVARQSFPANAIDVVAIEDLAGIAQSSGKMILHEEHEGLHTYYVEDAGVIYRFRATDDQGMPSENKQEVDA
jgi:signal peptidase I